MARVAFNEEDLLLETSSKSKINNNNKTKTLIMAPTSTLNASAPEFKQHQSMHPPSAITLNHQQYLNNNNKIEYPFHHGHVDFKQQHPGYAPVYYYPQNTAADLLAHLQSLHLGTYTNDSFTVGPSPPIPGQVAPVYTNNVHFGHGYMPMPAAPPPPFVSQFDHLNSVQWGVSQHWQTHNHRLGVVNTAPVFGPVPDSAPIKRTGRSRRRKKNKRKKNGAQQQQDHGQEGDQVNEQIQEPHEDVEGEHVEVEGEETVFEPPMVAEPIAVEPMVIESMFLELTTSEPIDV